MESHKKVNGLLYLITNIINNKMYGGQTIQSIDQRWGVHIFHVGKTNRPLYSAMTKYGIENFRIEIVDWAASVEELNRLEEELISNLDLTNRKNGYNIAKGGSNKSCSKETKIKISKAQKGEKGNMFGKQMPKETKEKISESLRGDKSPCFGVPKSEEHKRKLSAALIGFKHTEETKRKISEAGNKAIVCINTGIVFTSIKEASATTGISYSIIHRILNRKNKKPKEFIFQYVNI